MLNFLPMPHVVEIKKASPELDAWGLPIQDDLKESQKVASKIQYNTNNEEIKVASGEVIRYTAQILMEGVPDVDYQDFVTWSDSRGNIHTKNPVDIEYKYDLSGSPIAVRVTV